MSPAGHARPWVWLLGINVSALAVDFLTDAAAVVGALAILANALFSLYQLYVNWRDFHADRRARREREGPDANPTE